MPVYEYECQSCQEITETWQSISDAPLASCPACNGPVKKIISMSSFALKGKGWYADGYSSTPAPDKTKSCPSSTAGECPKNSGAGCGSC